MPSPAPSLNQALIEAATSGIIDDVIYFLRAGADPLVARDVDGATALMLAAHGNFFRLASILLPISLPTAVDHLGWNALMCAAAGDAIMCAELLVPYSCLLTRDHHGRLALDLVNRHGPDSEWHFLRLATDAALEREALALMIPASTVQGGLRL